MSDLAAELKDALAKDDVERIGHWRDIGLTQIARFPGSLSEEALDFLTRACVHRRDEKGLAAIERELPWQEVTPGNANIGLRNMAHLQMARAYLFRERKDPASAHRCFRSVMDLAAYFGDTEMREFAQRQMDVS